MGKIVYRFVPMGTVAKPAAGRVFLDVGNDLAPGVIDHHQPDAPDLCASMLVLEHPRLVAQTAGLSVGELMELVTHFFPDLDAITAVHFAEVLPLLEGRRPGAGAERWARYVCDVDRGYTRLDPNQPLTGYSLFLARMELATQSCDTLDKTAASARVLDAGRELIDWLLARIGEGAELDALAEAAASRPRGFGFSNRIRFYSRPGRAVIGPAPRMSAGSFLPPSN